MSWAEVQVLKNEIKNNAGSADLIIVTAPDYPNTEITLTNGTDTYTETSDSNGVANFYVSKGGTYTASLIDNNVTVNLGSTSFNTHEIEYKSQVKFAFHYSETNSDPDSVTYPLGYDNSDWGSDTAYMDYVNDTSYSVANGQQCPNNSSSIDNSAVYIIPLYIIGYKTGLFD